MESRICGNCFQKTENESGTCPHCGYNASENGRYYISALPIGTILDGKYTVGRVLGQGGFGITYLAWDCIKKEKVAIKEFFPCSIAVRKESVMVMANSTLNTELFKESLGRFWEEAGKLMHLGSLPGVAHVLGAFYENGTAYFAMEHIEGESLKELVERDGQLSRSDAMKLLMPVVETLIAVHRKKIIHQDIAPDNILIAKDGTVKLIDFGAARFDIGNITQDINSVVKQGFTPIEQYGNLRGATAVSDIYSIAATLYYAITEHCPPDALSRQNYDTLVAPSEYNPSVNDPEWEKILLKALSTNSENRHQTMQEFYVDVWGITPPPGFQITFYGPNRKIILQKWYPQSAKIKIPPNPKPYSEKLFAYEFAGWNPDVNPVAENHADYYAQFKRKIKPVYPLVATGILVCLIIAVLLGVGLKSVGKSDGSADETTAPTVVAEPAGPTENTDMHIYPTELPNLIPAIDIVSHAVASSTFTGDGVSHDVYNILDGDVNTNWTEGVSGHGIGEYVEFVFDQEYILKSLLVQSGVAYREDLFEKNSRPKSITLMLSDDHIIEYMLADTSALQEIVFEEPVTTSSLKIIINSVYPGSKREETAISEISFSAFKTVNGDKNEDETFVNEPLVSAGANYTLHLRSDGTVVSAGRNDYYQSSVSSWNGIIDMDAGWNHSVGLRSDGLVIACGSNSHGQCETTQWTDVVDVDVGWLHTVGVRSDGTVVAAGDNRYGQCDVSSWTDIVAVSAGFTHTVGLKKDGTVVSVGENTDGECDVSSMRNVKAIYTGADHTIALHPDGTVTSVGANDYGECEVSEWTNVKAVSASSTYTLGLKNDGTVVLAGSRLPEGFDVSGWRNVIAIAAGQTHAVGICSDGSIVTTGMNQYGEADAAILQSGMESYPHANSQYLKQSSLGGGYKHTVVLKDDGTLTTAGSNEDGQCNVSDWTDIVYVSAGENYTVGLKKDGTVIAVGDNSYGQGNVSEWNNIIAVSAGTRHTVGLQANGTVVAVGENKNGQCDVSAWSGIIAVEAGYKHTVGLKADGTVVATGLNTDGQCNVSDWTDIVSISSEGWHTVGLKSDGTVVAVGRNTDGQCNVADWTNIIAITAEGWHTVGLKADGTVVAVGLNDGQCNVESWKNVIAIAAGNDHTIGLQADGTLLSVGENKFGQCGISGWNLNVAEPYNQSTRPYPIKGIITANGVIIRNKPSTDGEYRGTLYKGDIVAILETKQGWGRIDRGWINMQWFAQS